MKVYISHMDGRYTMRALNTHEVNLHAAGRLPNADYVADVLDSMYAAYLAHINQDTVYQQLMLMLDNELFDRRRSGQ